MPLPHVVAVLRFPVKIEDRPLLGRKHILDRPRILGDLLQSIRAVAHGLRYLLQLCRCIDLSARLASVRTMLFHLRGSFLRPRHRAVGIPLPCGFLLVLQVEQFREFGEIALPVRRRIELSVVR